MNFGVMLSPQEVEQGVQNVSAAESAGFDFVGLSDSQSLLLELYTNLGFLSSRTDAAEFGPSVTNPVTRHPVVTASAICTLNEITEGRAVLGVASGDSAVFTLGERPARLRELVEFVELFKALSRGESVTYEGTEQELSWVQAEDGHRPPPVMLAADGPKTQTAGGSVADRLLIGNGRTPAIIEKANERIDEGAREAGRDPDDVERWAWVRTLIADEPNEHRDVLARMMAAAAHHNFQFGPDEFVPDEYAEPARTLAQEYQSDHHADWGADPNRKLVERLDEEHDGFLEFLLNRFAVVGPPETCVEEFERIAAIDGLDAIHLCPINPSNHTFVTRMGESILPHFQ